MATPIAKRRKLDPSSALTKPFKSPLIRKTSSTPSHKPPSSALDSISPSKPVSELLHNSTSNESEATTPLKHYQVSNTLSHSSPTKPSLGAPDHDSADLNALQSRVTFTQRTLSSLQRTLDTSQQALHLKHSNRDDDLERLSDKWKSAARSAAEELFAAAKDKVNAMGGMNAWQEREREKRNKFSQGFGWDEPAKLMAEDGDGAIEGEDWREREDEIKRENDDHEDDGKYGAKAEKDDSEEFTMDVMLSSLSIDPKILGFDRERQCWI